MNNSSMSRFTNDNRVSGIISAFGPDVLADNRGAYF
jgi:hypothetical protein